MTTKSRPARLLRFASFRLDAVNTCLWRGTKTIRLTPKAFAVLQCLVERPSELVTKEALLEAVWPATVVGDAVLKVCVREIRKALGDPAGAPRYIATVHRLGYRFIAGVADSADGRAASEEPAAPAPAEPALTRRVPSEGVGHLLGRERAMDRLQSHRSEYRAAAHTAEEGLRLALDVGDAYHHMTCQFHRAWALLHLGEWGAMRRTLNDGLAMAEQNEHHLWARAFRFQTAWLFVHACDFERARELCQQELAPVREGQLGELLGSIVLGCAQLGAKRYAAAQRAFDDVTERTDGRPVLMDWILQMPLRLGCAESWLARRALGRAREQAEELCRLARIAGERTYLALGRRVLAEVALAGRDGATADRELSHALDAIADHDAPLAEWRVCATAARSEEAHGRQPRAHAYLARSVAVLDRLAASLVDDADLRRPRPAAVVGAAPTGSGRR